MERKFGVYIFLGMIIGVIFGTGIGAANGNPIIGLWLGSVVGGYLGWFVAIAARENQEKNQSEK